MVCSSYGSLPWLLKILVETCILEHLLLGLKQLKKVSLTLKLKSVSSSLLSSSSKSMKLNPKLVGAAWDEKIKMEMEMEKREELVKSDFDADWLPNFGRVWQSGLSP